MARLRFARSLNSLIRLILFPGGFLIILYILRTPTTPYYAPGRAKPPEPDNKIPRSRLPQQLQQFLSWSPPTDDPDHYPPYNAYTYRDYDPNRWEAFPQNTGVFVNSSVKRMPSDENMPQPFLPYPAYSNERYQREWLGQYIPCEGPSGKIIDGRVEDLVHGFQGIPDGFPYPDVGSWEAVGLDENICFDRYSRLGPYGFEDSLGPSRSTTKRDLNGVKWGSLQSKCLAKNKSRFELANAPEIRPGIGSADDEKTGTTNTAKRDVSQDQSELHKRDAWRDSESNNRMAERRAHSHNKQLSKPYKARSAVLIRTWDDYQYTENDLLSIRSLISELALQSGGEYSVFLFVNVKDMSRPIWTSDVAYNDALNQYVPAEFHDMAILWNEQVCQEWYPKVGEWSVYWEQFMPVQWFSRTHPEFDYVWNWEMDARYIGQHYHFLENIGNFAKKQPRKFLWERNSRFYIPAVHGNYDNFTQNTNFLVQLSKPLVQTVWGKQPWADEQTEHLMGPDPPRTEDADDFTWGVGEEADFISLLPIWDPKETWWAYRDKLFNYPLSDRSSEERPFPHVPRRVFINTLVRFSAELLTAMHYENTAGLSMASEMWPATIALQHGFKAVYAPHPIWQSHIWPADYMDITFNADGWGAGSTPGHNIDDGRGITYDRERALLGEPMSGTGPNGEGRLGRWTQERDSPYNPDREHNFAGWSWYFWSDFPRIIYWRWMGWRAGFSIVTIGGRKVTDELGLAGGPDWEKDNGRMCLPSMLLHPVKDVKPPGDDPYG